MVVTSSAGDSGLIRFRIAAHALHRFGAWWRDRTIAGTPSEVLQQNARRA